MSKLPLAARLLQLAHQGERELAYRGECKSLHVHWMFDQVNEALQVARDQFPGLVISNWMEICALNCVEEGERREETRLFLQTHIFATEKQSNRSEDINYISRDLKFAAVEDERLKSYVAYVVCGSEQ